MSQAARTEIVRAVNSEKRDGAQIGIAASRIEHDAIPGEFCKVRCLHQHMAIKGQRPGRPSGRP
jgi:hypothetical protein